VRFYCVIFVEFPYYPFQFVGTGFGDDGAKALAEALAVNSTLKDLVIMRTIAHNHSFSMSNDSNHY